MIPEKYTDTIYSYEDGKLKELKSKDYNVGFEKAVVQKGEYCTFKLYYIIEVKKTKTKEKKLWRFLNEETIEDKVAGKFILGDHING